jgi:hypothetical protein
VFGLKPNDRTKYVELAVEDFRTRVRFPPPPPVPETNPLSGWSFFAYSRAYSRVSARVHEASCGPQAKRSRCADLFAAVLAWIVNIILRMVPIFPDRDGYVTTALEAAKTPDREI